MPRTTGAEVVVCHRCGHGYPAHAPVCSAPAPDDTWCGCRGFRWVDPAAAHDRYGLVRPVRHP